MDRVLHIAGWVSFALLAGGIWTENFVVGRLQNNERFRRKGWKRVFVSTKRLIEAHELSGADPRWIRLQKAANAATFAGCAGILILVVAACIVVSR